MRWLNFIDTLVPIELWLFIFWLDVIDATRIFLNLRCYLTIKESRPPQRVTRFIDLIFQNVENVIHRNRLSLASWIIILYILCRIHAKLIMRSFQSWFLLLFSSGMVIAIQIPNIRGWSPHLLIIFHSLCNIIQYAAKILTFSHLI
jgi:hypothetical protein